ncbi:MAG: hypothetical protein VKK63_04790 [Synechococcus sp.]|nr:hypothetical protein [Synechococcus sp.]
MGDHNSQQLTAREMVRAHAYPVLAAISGLSLVCIAVLQIPAAVKNHRYNLCIDEQVSLRHASNLAGQDGPGKLIYLKAVQHCEGR